MEKTEVLLKYVKGEPKFLTPEYDRWRNNCYKIGEKLKFPVQFYPLYDDSLLVGLTGFGKKMGIWETTNTKVYTKYNKILTELVEGLQ